MRGSLKRRCLHSVLFRNGHAFRGANGRRTQTVFGSSKGTPRQLTLTLKIKSVACVRPFRGMRDAIGHVAHPFARFAVRPVGRG